MIGSFRIHFLSLSLLVGIAAPWAAIAQAPISSVGSGSVDDRVTQLERISNAQGQLLTQLQQQLSDNQSDIDILRGQIQENQYQLNQVVERQKNIILQIDSLSSSPSSLNQGDNSAANPEQNASVTSPVSVVQGNDANSDYNAAIALMRDNSRQDEAITAFQNFVKAYPNSTYLPNAHYWLGQLNYNKGKRDDATFYFASVVKNYPESPKASDAMLKVGIIMQDKGDVAKAKAVYQQVVKQYPGSDAAKQAQKRLTAL